MSIILIEWHLTNQIMGISWSLKYLTLDLSHFFIFSIFLIVIFLFMYYSTLCLATAFVLYSGFRIPRTSFITLNLFSIFSFLLVFVLHYIIDLYFIFSLYPIPACFHPAEFSNVLFLWILSLISVIFGLWYNLVYRFKMKSMQLYTRAYSLFARTYCSTYQN